MGPGVWGVSFDNSGASEGLTGAAITAEAGADAGQFSFIASVITNGTNSYATGNQTGQAPDATLEVTDNGGTAVLHATGSTVGGGHLDLTVNCPSVTRA